MRKFPILIALALAGCGTTGTAPTASTPSANQAVFIAAGSLSTAEQVAAAYEALPSCLPGVGLTCPATTSNPNTVALIKHYDTQAFNALQPLITTAQSGGNVTDTAEVEAAQAAVAALANYLVSQGVK
jgi:hypothetical protein